MDYHTLNYLSLTSVSVALLIACLLPPVPFSVYFHRQHYKISGSEGESSANLTENNGKENWVVNMKKVCTGEYLLN